MKDLSINLTAPADSFGIWTTLLSYLDHLGTIFTRADPSGSVTLTPGFAVFKKTKTKQRLFLTIPLDPMIEQNKF